jgi:hypothetical protein
MIPTCRFSIRLSLDGSHSSCPPSPSPGVMVVQTAGKHSAITRINRDWETRKSSYVMAARRKNAAQANAPHSAPHTAPSPPRPGRRPPSRRPGSGRLGHAGRRPGATVAQIATDARSSRAIAGRELAVLGTSGLATGTP